MPERGVSGRAWVDVLAVTLVALLVVLAVPRPPAAGATTDPRRSQLWWFDVLGIETAWATSRGEGVVVAVVDTGVQLDHPDLVGQFATADDGTVGRDLVEDTPLTGDPNGHGTLVAGLVAAVADNGIGAAGVAPRARLLPVRVLDADGRGRAGTVDAGIRWAVDNGADVINLSLEVDTTSGGADATRVAPNAAIEEAWARGVVVVAAAGNAGAGALGYPPDSPVLLVGATDPDDEPATAAGGGRADAVLAPGTDMVATWCLPVDGGDGGNGGCDAGTPYGIGTGTSFAAPVASGVVALLLGMGLGPEQAVRVLRDTAVDLGPAGPDGRFGVGRIDAAAAAAAGTAVLATEGPVLDTAPVPSPSPTASASLAEEAPALDVPGAAAPAPPANEAVVGTGPREPAGTPPALPLAVVLLVVGAVVAAVRGAFTPRRRVG